MLYILIPTLFCIFFIWATILETVAHFFIQATIHNLKWNLLPILLRIGCALSFIAGFFTYLPTHPIYFIFISALWITIHTDLYYMLISRLVSLYLAPIGIIASTLGLLPISATESILTALFGGGFLLTTNAIFKRIKGHDGLGQGDIELLACIGAWIGFLGTWNTIVISSITGTIMGAIYLLWTRQQVRILPFGPFLALAALLFLTYPKLSLLGNI